MELPQVVRRPEQEQRRGPCLTFDKVRVRFFPAVPDGAFVEDFYRRRLSIDKEFQRRSGWRQFLVVGHILPKESKIFGREGMSVRPLVAAPQPEGELAALLLLVPFKQVGMEHKLVIVDDQASVTVCGHQPSVAGGRDEHVQLATWPAGTISASEFPDYPRRRGYSLANRRQSTGFHLIGKHWSFPQHRQWVGRLRTIPGQTPTHGDGKYAPLHSYPPFARAL